MGDWIATGAGSPDFNDNYTENGTYNGKNAYEGDANSKWLWWNSTLGRWALADTKGGAEYYVSDAVANLPANPWQIIGGMSAAPTLAAITETFNHISGGASVFGGAELLRGPWHANDGGAVVFAGAELLRGTHHNADGGAAVFDGAALTRGPWANIDGGVLVFDGAGLANVFDAISGGVIVFSGGQVVPVTENQESIVYVLFEGGQVSQITRGGGQSTTEWDWVRGKVK